MTTDLDQPPPPPSPLPLLHRLRVLLIRAVLRALRLFSPALDRLLTRLSASPGLPVPSPSDAYWQHPRARCGEEDVEVPGYADVVVLGSGITGTAFVRTLLGLEGCTELDVVMLEAREVCSGATGRNGGHVTPVLYEQYPELKRVYGGECAREIMRFRMAHLPALLEAAEEEGLVEVSQCRWVETTDVFWDREQLEESKRRLGVYVAEMREEGGVYRVREEREEIKELQLDDEKTAGCISTRAGAVHPYRLVTGILSRLLREHPSFRLFTRTPCTSVCVAVRENVELYEVTTPRGTIRTPHVVHATNGWVAHLLPGMRGKILPARGTMTAQTVGIERWAGERSFVFFPGKGTRAFDYLTQQPVGRGGEGEMMLGGKWDMMEDMGSADDAGWDEKAGRYLSGALDKYFVWRGEGVRKTWSGVLGISADGQPWVGRIPEAVAGRRAPRLGVEGSGGNELVRGGLARPGEWMAAGYSGEGMVHAWLSGKALAYMVSGNKIPNQLPSIYGITENRWARAGIELLFGFSSLFM